jgi:hypothetical protein
MRCASKASQNSQVTRSISLLSQQQPQQQQPQQQNEKKDSDGVAGWIKDMFGGN